MTVERDQEHEARKAAKLPPPIPVPEVTMNP